MQPYIKVILQYDLMMFTQTLARDKGQIFLCCHLEVDILNAN